MVKTVTICQLHVCQKAREVGAGMAPEDGGRSVDFIDSAAVLVSAHNQLDNRNVLLLSAQCLLQVRTRRCDRMPTSFSLSRPAHTRAEFISLTMIDPCVMYRRRKLNRGGSKAIAGELAWVDVVVRSATEAT